MIAKFELSQADLEVAVREYFAKRGLKELNYVSFDAVMSKDFRGEVYGKTVSAKVGIEIDRLPDA